MPTKKQEEQTCNINSKRNRGCFSVPTTHFKNFYNSHSF